MKEEKIGIIGNISKEEFEKLKELGMLWELYPNADEVYERNKKI